MNKALLLAAASLAGFLAVETTAEARMIDLCKLQASQLNQRALNGIAHKGCPYYVNIASLNGSGSRGGYVVGYVNPITGVSGSGGAGAGGGAGTGIDVGALGGAAGNEGGINVGAGSGAASNNGGGINVGVGPGTASNNTGGINADVGGGGTGAGSNNSGGINAGVGGSGGLSVSVK